jgi:hypothetical protein
MGVQSETIGYRGMGKEVVAGYAATVLLQSPGNGMGIIKFPSVIVKLTVGGLGMCGMTHQRASSADRSPPHPSATEVLRPQTCNMDMRVKILG